MKQIVHNKKLFIEFNYMCDNGAYTQRRITKTNYFVSRKSNSTVMKAQTVHKSRRSEDYFHKERDGRTYNDAYATVMLNRVMKHYEPLWLAMSYIGPEWPTMSQNIHTMTHYDPKLRKLFWNDPKQLLRPSIFVKFVPRILFSSGPETWKCFVLWNLVQWGIQGCWFWIPQLFP